MVQPEVRARLVEELIVASQKTQTTIARHVGVSAGLLTHWKDPMWLGTPRLNHLHSFLNWVGASKEKRSELLRACGYEVSVPEPDTDADRADQERYLAVLHERYGGVGTHAFQDEQLGTPHRLDLLGERGVYEPLFFDRLTVRQEQVPTKPRRGTRRPGDTGDEARPLSLADVLRIPSHVALIGDAGSGKSTVLRVLTMALAAEDPQVIVPDLVPALPTPRPLPILLPLRYFVYACHHPRPERAYQLCVTDLLRFVDDCFADWSPRAKLPAGFLARHVCEGSAWLMLDALDEVADATERQTMRDVIRELAGQVGTTRLLVTARVTAYRRTELGDPFTVVRVRDLEDEQRAHMAHRIYSGLALPDAVHRAQQLVRKFEQSAALRTLARTPVMVWTAAVIHAYKGDLPETRAALYDKYVDVLLTRSHEGTQLGAEALKEVTAHGWSPPERRCCLSYVAFEMHRRQESEREQGEHPEKEPESREERRAVTGEDELVNDILVPFWRKEDPTLSVTAARRRARDFLTQMTEESGLLYETNEGYTIGDHLSMQEFLAACYLVEEYQRENPEDYGALLRDRAGASWWQEVLVLAAGYLATKPSQEARRFLQRIAAQGTEPAARLVALTLAGKGLTQFRVLAPQQRPRWYSTIARELADPLSRMLHGMPISAPMADRQEAGLVLGLLYESGVEGLSDPRFAGPLGLPEFVPIAGGPFWMGEDGSDEKDERPRHRVYLHPFAIARYPTTCAMYARFVDAHGYEDPQWWPEAIAVGYWQDGRVRDWIGEDRWRDRPWAWDDPGWNNPTQPVVGVNWYEAVAFCHWLTERLQAAGELGSDQQIRLPTEAEWERAARGPTPAQDTPGRRYPWEGEWQEDRCNSEEAGLGATSPVGMFPRGATPDGIHDLAGNVFEWCLDWYDAGYYAASHDAHNPQGPEKGDTRVLRGGSWWNEGPKVCRCGVRNRDDPGNWYDNWGFRCLRASSS